MKRKATLLLALTLALSALAAPMGAEDAPVDGPQAAGYEGEADGGAQAPRLSDGQKGEGDIADPRQYWAQNGYPDDVSFACEAGGEVRQVDGQDVVYSYWEIGAVDMGEQRRQEILDLLAPTCLVTFVPCRYSYAQRRAAADELLARGDENLVQVTLILNTEKVRVQVAPGTKEQYAGELTRQYGDLVDVTDEEMALAEKREDGQSLWQTWPRPGISQPADGDAPAPQARAGAPVWPFALLAALAALVALVPLAASRRALLQRAGGGADVRSGAPGGREIVEAVRQSVRAPREELWEAIRRETAGK